MVNRLGILAPPLIVASLFIETSPTYAGNYAATILYPLSSPGGDSPQPRMVSADGTVGDEFPAAGLSGPTDALLWSPPDGTVTDLTPTTLGSVSSSAALAAAGGQQVGYFASASTDNERHAVLWSGAPGSAVDLNPMQLGAFSSTAFATDGAEQVGRGLVGSPAEYTSHALLWTGTAASAIDLNPTDLGPNVGSFAFGVSGNREVGYYSSPTTPIHAVLWTGAANSAVDLHPLNPTLQYSIAIATSGTQQVGEARANGAGTEAFLWFGTAASAVNLNPTSIPGVDSSRAVATNGFQQVGSGYSQSATTDDDRALIWSNNANSVIDLHSILPSTGSWNFSDADSIDAARNVFGTANGTFNGATGYFAVEWVAVPEPAAGSLLVLAAIGCFARRRPLNP
jgi:hypothetical protein